jgi:DNA mismatch repair protein MutL
VLAGGIFPSRWIPDAVPLKPETMGAAESGARGTGHDPENVVSGLTGTDDPIAGLDRTRPADAADIRPMIPLGQFRDTFIIAVDDEGIAIIDQHVAHERVLFERVMQRLTDGTIESQLLLVPLLLELAPAACEALQARSAELQRLGFEIEAFGPSTIKVSSVPALLNSADASRALRALSEDLEGIDRGAQVQEALQRIAATTACHAAVKANYPLSYEKMAHILEELRRTAYSTVCPHGRPVMLRLTRREIEKNFERI